MEGERGGEGGGRSRDEEEGLAVSDGGVIALQGKGIDARGPHPFPRTLHDPEPRDLDPVASSPGISPPPLTPPPTDEISPRTAIPILDTPTCRRIFRSEL